MTRRNAVVWMIFTLIAAASLSAAMASTRDELRQRFKQRYSALLDAKNAGKLGEVSTGFVEAVSGDKGVADLISAENTDRRELYKLLAEDQKTTPEKVAQLNAERNFKNAFPGHYLKGPDGKWYQKQ